ncbi:MAG: hypothetical protein ACI4TK_01005 [Agathobacter sp.]
MRFLDFKKMVCNHILYQDKRKEICGDCQWNELCNGRPYDNEGKAVRAV